MTGGTGRIIGQLGQRSQQIVYGDLSAVLEEELRWMVTVDRAHLVMLAERELVPIAAVRQLLRCLAELAAQRFGPLRGRPAPRGLYLMYEGYLMERLGADTGGVLHTGRSRNDLKATLTRLRTRDRVLELAEQVIRLEAILLARARAYREVVMPVYTHFQAALPISYGYYLLGLAAAIGREVDALIEAAAELRRCPLGAGAAAGTDLPIDPDRTAALLGFEAPAAHALDAVASRDFLLRLVGAAAGITVTLSRLATDLQVWSTAEFGLVEFPDRLVGGSSAMPQKRNAFLLEHVKAKPGQAIGAWTAAATAMAGTPFTNTIEVGTEAVDRIWPGLRAAEEAALLSQVLVSGARPVPARMAARAEDGFTAATAVANRLVRQGIPFRLAHQQVGEAVRRAIEAGERSLADHGPPGWLDQVGVSTIDLSALVREHRYGGGPGASAHLWEQACRQWEAHRRWLARWRAQVTGAAEAADRAVRALLDGG